MKLYATLIEAFQKPTSESNFDVKYYKLDLTISTSPRYLRGVVTMKAVSIASNLTTIALDLANTMTVDSVRTGSTELAFVEQQSTLTVTLGESCGSGDIVMVDVYYRGEPVGRGFPSFTFTSHGGTPWVYTFSEPNGARDWWPCKDPSCGQRRLRGCMGDGGQRPQLSGSNGKTGCCDQQRRRHEDAPLGRALSHEHVPSSPSRSGNYAKFTNLVQVLLPIGVHARG